MAKKPKKQQPPNEPKRTATLRFDLGVHYQFAINDHKRTIVSMIELKEQIDALNSSIDESQEAQLVDKFHGLEKTRGMWQGKLYRLERLLKHKLNRQGCALEPIVEFHATDWLDPIAEQKMKNSLDVLRSKRLAKLYELRKQRRKAAQQQRKDEPLITEANNVELPDGPPKGDNKKPALIVDAGKFRISYNGKTLKFNNTDSFKLLTRFANRKGNAIQSTKVIVSALKRKLKDEHFKPIAEAIRSVGGKLYELDPDGIGGVQLIKAQNLDAE